MRTASSLAWDSSQFFISRSRAARASFSSDCLRPVMSWNCQKCPLNSSPASMGMKSMDRVLPSVSASSRPLAIWRRARSASWSSRKASGSWSCGWIILSSSIASPSARSWAGTGTWNISQKGSLMSEMQRSAVSTRMAACMFSIRALSLEVSALRAAWARLRSVMSLMVPETPVTTPPSPRVIRVYISTHRCWPPLALNRNSPRTVSSAASMAWVSMSR